jgi:hypothetical protein
MSDLSSSSSDVMDINLTGRLDILIDMNKNLLAQILEQNKLIQELQRENQKILADTTKMASHVDFINSIYSRTRQSTFFRTLLG